MEVCGAAKNPFNKGLWDFKNNLVGQK